MSRIHDLYHLINISVYEQQGINLLNPPITFSIGRGLGGESTYFARFSA